MDDNKKKLMEVAPLILSQDLEEIVNITYVQEMLFLTPLKKKIIIFTKILMEIFTLKYQKNMI